MTVFHARRRHTHLVADLFAQGTVHLDRTKHALELLERNPARPQRRGTLPASETTVDSTPTAHGPPSTIAGILPPRSSITWPEVVVDGLPERLAEGAASGTPASRMSARATRVRRQADANRIQPCGDLVRDTGGLGQNDGQRPGPKRIRKFARASGTYARALRAALCPQCVRSGGCPAAALWQEKSLRPPRRSRRSPQGRRRSRSACRPLRPPAQRACLPRAPLSLMGPVTGYSSMFSSLLYPTFPYVINIFQFSLYMRPMGKVKGDAGLFGKRRLHANFLPYASCVTDSPFTCPEIRL